MKRVLYFIVILTLFASCKGTIYEIHQNEFYDMVVSKQVDSVEIINLEICEVFLKPQFIASYKNDFTNIRLTGPQFYFSFGSVDYLEKYILELQSEVPKNELIKIKYTDRKSLSDRLLIVLIELHGLIALVFFFIILMKKFERKTDKVVWIVMVVLLPIIGILLYGLIGRKQIVKSNSV